VGYVYQAVYYQPADFPQAFASAGGSPLSNNQARQEITIWQETEQLLGSPKMSTAALGDWTIDIQHFYLGKTLFLGDGTHRSGKLINFDVIDTVAGNGNYGFSGDGGPATAATLGGDNALAPALDGGLYIADAYNYRVRYVDTSGTIHTIAGTGDSGFSGDGGPAIAAQLGLPRGLAVGPDGSLYIADAANQRVRRIDGQGIITTIAGNGGYGSVGDGGPATDASLSGPSDVDVAPDGTVYIADTNANRIRRVSTNGIISTFAGNGTYGFSGDGGSAVAAQLSAPLSLAVAPDGSVYIADTANYSIRKVGTDGIISTVAGNGSFGFGGDGASALAARLNFPLAVDVAQDGTFYIADQYNARIRAVDVNGIITTVAGNGVYDQGAQTGDHGPALSAPIFLPSEVAVAANGTFYLAGGNRVRHVSPPLRGLTAGENAVPSQDGSEVYIFDSTGRHLRTLNALTGAVVYQFGYDSAGRLTTITDGDNNVTTIQRDSSGNPTGILSPYGQLTTLQRDANGYLSQITNPAGNAYKMVYTSRGLLTSFTDPRNFATTFAYDAVGRLTQHFDPAGGSMTLSLTQNGDQKQVTLTTAMNRVTTYDLGTSALDVQSRLNTLPGGYQFGRTLNPDGTRASTAPDGASTTWALGPDPRWGMVAPINSSVKTTTPSGKTLTTSETRTAALADQSDPFSLVTLTDNFTLNGRTYGSVYDAASRTFTLTSPVGRTSTITIDTPTIRMDA
jgi:YD repeat-containing protein